MEPVHDDRRLDRGADAAVRPQELSDFPTYARPDLCRCDPRTEFTHRIQRTILARPQRLLRHWRIHGRDPDGSGRHRLLLDAAGRRRDLFRGWISVRPAGVAA